MPVTRAYLRCLWHGGRCRETPWYSLGLKHCEWTIWLRSTNSHWTTFGLLFPPQNTKMTWSNLLESEIFESTIFWNCKYLENTAYWKSQEAVRDSWYITWPREGDLDVVRPPWLLMCPYSPSMLLKPDSTSPPVELSQAEISGPSSQCLCPTG